MKAPSTLARPRAAALRAASAAVFVAAAAASASAQTVTVDEASSLFVTDVGVVDDARARGAGSWSFGTLMRELSGDIPAERFVEAWIDTLEDTNQVSGDPAMNSIPLTGPKEVAFDNFFSTWRNRSAGGVLDLDTAPFRLLAIVNRPDLLGVQNGQVTSAGEARFIFAAVQPDEPDLTLATSGSRRFFVIFEYDVPASTCEELKAWHQRWQDLGALSLGSPAYNAALESITDDFIRRDTSHPGLNGSKLSQLRINSFALEQQDLHWDLREWTLGSRSGFPNLAILGQATTKQTPALRYIRRLARNLDLANWMNAERNSILAGAHVIPDNIAGAGSRPFLGGLAVNAQELQGRQTPNTPAGSLPSGGTLWWAPGFANDNAAGFIVSEEDALVRHGFAMQTCSGCHFHETGTDGIVQDPLTGHRQTFSMTTARDYLQETNLSPFLTGTESFPDPVNPIAIRSVFDPASGTTAQTQVAVNHQFDDLARRATILGRILNLDCGSFGLMPELQSIQDMTGTRVH